MHPEDLEKILETSDKRNKKDSEPDKTQSEYTSEANVLAEMVKTMGKFVNEVIDWCYLLCVCVYIYIYIYV